MAAAADVPGKYDCVINGTGYLFDDTTPERKAAYGYSPTFVERQNVQGNYGDNQQDFWLTASQNDWSEGSEQRFFRAQDEQSRSSYWRSSAVDISTPGQASLLPDIRSLDFGVGISALATCPNANFSSVMYGASNTNLYEIAADGTITDRGAHGAGSLNAFGLAPDGTVARIFIAGATKTRKYDTSGHTFADFSATTTSAVAYLNNTLYGMSDAYTTLYRFDTAGAATTEFTWKDATGATSGSPTKLVPFGGKLAMVRLAGPDGGELWIYDGVSVNRLAQFPANFLAHGVAVVNGIIFVGGALATENLTKYESAIYYYANGSIGLLWRSYKPSTSLTYCTVAAWQGKLLFSDETEGRFVFYEPSTGAFSSPGTFTQSSAAGGAWSAGGTTSFTHVRNTRFGYLFPSTARPSSGTLTSSLFDFDSSLDKYMRSVKVDFDAGTDGDGGSVDIAYQLNSVDGSWTTLQTGAVAGTEYFVNQKARSIAFKITLNKGTSTLGPVLKRLYSRAAPILQQFPLRTYSIACFGDADAPQVLRDNLSTNPKTGREQANDLITAVQSTTPITITDRFGTYTGFLEPGNFQLEEVHAEPLSPPAKSGSFIARVLARGI